ncbi:hypothetical protein pipiens_019204 [Culex pipiens pipiens]|uniref:Uncharacterized protein n=1 Tax=Culex pipiens pipiens TaxID=38569 RepID=A0ABD1DVN4_CULPP
MSSATNCLIKTETRLHPCEIHKTVLCAINNTTTITTYCGIWNQNIQTSCHKYISAPDVRKGSRGSQNFVII